MRSVNIVEAMTTLSRLVEAIELGDLLLTFRTV
jgi:hypothetical protein